jgi:hypothetical protein
MRTSISPLITFVSAAVRVPPASRSFPLVLSAAFCSILLGLHSVGSGCHPNSDAYVVNKSAFACTLQACMTRAVVVWVELATLDLSVMHADNASLVVVRILAAA